MKTNLQDEAFASEQKITALIRTLRETERELHALTGGKLDFVVGESGQPYLLHEVQEKLLHSEAAQRQLAETQLAILNALPAHIALIDSQGIILAVNEAWRRFATANVLQGPEFAIGQNYLEVCERAQGDCSDEAQEVANGIRRVLSGELDQFCIEYPCHSPAEKRWFRLMVTPLIAGQPGGAVVMHVNVTERRLAEEAMRASEQQFSSAFENAMIGMALVAPDGHWLKVNQSLCDLIGYSGEELKGHTFQEITHTDDLHADLEHMQDLLAGKERFYTMEKRYFHKQGKLIWVLLSVSLIRSADGKPVYFISQIQDITHRKQAEELLIKSQRRLTLATKSAQIGIWDWDAVNNKLIWDDQMFLLYGISRKDFKGAYEAWQNGLHPDDRAGAEADLAATLARGKRFDTQFRVIWPNGEVHHIQAYADVQRAADGAATNVVGVIWDITERKLAEEAIRTSENRLRTIFDSEPECVKIVSADGRVLDINPAGLQIVEAADSAAVLNLPVCDLIHPEDRTVFMDLHQRACRGETGRGEYRVIGLKGTERWMETNSAPLHEPDGTIQSVLSVSRDISERRCAELELTRLNRALRLLSSTNETLIHATEENLLLKDVCRLAVEVGGYRMVWVGYAENDEGRTITPQAHAGKDDGYLKIIKLSWLENVATGQGPAGRTIRTGKPVICEDINIDFAMFPWQKDALTRGYRSVICLPLCQNGRTFGVLALYAGEINEAGTDELKLLQELADDLAFGITNLRAQAEHSVAQQKIAEQAALLNQTTDAIMVRDLEDRIRFWNKGAERVYGWSAEEVIGSCPREFLVADPFGFDAARRRLIEKGEWQGECEKKTKAGRLVTVDCRWTLLRDEQGNPKALFVIESDITEKKKIEAQFLRNQRMESIGTLASGIAHDLNNVLAPIMMSVQMLKHDVKDDETLNLLENLEACSKRGADLVKQVLSFSRGIEGQRVVVNPGHILRELKQVLHETFPKSIVLDFNIKRDLWTVTGDPTQLHQIFMNLCVNARDAMPNGGQLTVILENYVVDDTYAAMNPDSRPGSYVVANIVDTGTGIPLEIRGKIFEPFFTTKEIGKGTGLGLSTTLGIIKSHGGFINLYSEMGKGTKFKVYLPANTTDAAAEKVAIEQTGLPYGQGELILVVDDEEAIRKVAKQTLERYGYRVSLASNGAEAIAHFAVNQKEIAVILTDMAMPVMDGPSLIIAAKAINPHVRIIGSSGNASNGGLAKAIGAGVEHFIPKPYTAEALLKVLQKVLNN